MSYHSSWKRALLAAEAPIPSGLHASKTPSVERRFQVYRNNVFASLIDTLGETFSVSRALVGDNFFRDMAREYIALSPPIDSNLADYGQGFAAFIQDYAPARSLPYLADVARLERIYADVYHAADAKPLSIEITHALVKDTARLANCQLVLHPAFKVLRSPFAVGSIWAAHHGHHDLAEVTPYQGESIWVLRTHLQVAVQLMRAGDYCFAQAIMQGDTLGMAADNAISIDSAFDLTDCLASMFRHGLMVELLPG